MAAQFWSASILKPPVDPDNEQAKTTAQIVKFLPLMIGWFSLNVPSGLSLYYFSNTVLTSAQQVQNLPALVSPAMSAFAAHPASQELPLTSRLCAPMCCPFHYRFSSGNLVEPQSTRLIWAPSRTSGALAGSSMPDVSSRAPA